MRPTTLRRLAIAAVVLVLGVVSIVLIQQYQVSRLGQSNLSKADQAAKAGDLRMLRSFISSTHKSSVMTWNPN